MIENAFIKKFLINSQNALGIMPGADDTWGKAQIFRGVFGDTWKNAYPANCLRHILVFEKFNIIPAFCFNCYKIQIKVSNVVDLIKLLLIFHELKLPNDNTRKCYVDDRPDIEGSYAGLIYYQDLNECDLHVKGIKRIIDENISSNSMVIRKRGCSEYPVKYPEYGLFDENNHPIMQYKPEWKDIESNFDKQDMAGHLKPLNIKSNNKPGFDAADIRIIHKWLRYAASIGDSSYFDIIDQPVKPFSNIPFKNFSFFNG